MSRFKHLRWPMKLIDKLYYYWYRWRSLFAEVRCHFSSTTKYASFGEKVWFWVTWTLAPAGLIGSVFSLVDLFNGIVKWKGVINFVGTYWKTNIVQRFQELSSILSVQFGFPLLNDFIVSYLTLGLMLFISGLRSFNQLLIGREMQGSMGRYEYLLVLRIGKYKRYISKLTVYILSVFEFPIAMLFWPIIFVCCIKALYLSVKEIRRDQMMSGSCIILLMAGDILPYLPPVKRFELYGMVLAPFLIFFLLFVANLFISPVP